MDEPKLFTAQQYHDSLLRHRLLGLIEGVELFAWWKDGEQFVGTCGRTLKTAVTNLVNTFGADEETLKELSCKGWNFIKTENGFQLAPSSPSHVVLDDTSIPVGVDLEQVKSMLLSPSEVPSTQPSQNFSQVQKRAGYSVE